MKSKFCAWVLSVLAAGIAVPASATPVILNFDVLGLQATRTGLAVADTYKNLGFSFSTGALAFHNGVPNDVNNVTNPPCIPANCSTPNGFVRNEAGKSFTIQVLDGFSFDGLTLDFARSPKAFSFTIFSRPDINGLVQQATVVGPATLAGWAWTMNCDVLNGCNPGSTTKGSNSTAGVQFGLIDRIEFTPDVDGLFGLDNLRFNPSATASVPEPASLALVVLALGATGMAGRRRKSA